MNKATIKDIAKEADVSIATVSLVINNNGRISQSTRNRVLKAIRKYNYHPSRSARGLVSQKTGNIGFILTQEHFLRTEAFYTRVFLGTEFDAQANDYYVLLSTISSVFKNGDTLPRFILERNFDGIIIAGKVPDDFIDSISTYKKPIVFLDYQPTRGDFPSIQIDNVKGGILATEHLINYGHKDISFIGGEISHPSIRDRLIGYKLALERADIKIDDRLVIANNDYQSRQNGYQCAQILFSNGIKPTAIFASNDDTAIGIMQYIKDRKYSIPDDISVIGFDDVETDLLIDPPLSSISVPKVKMGTEALQLLHDILNTKINTAKKIIVPVELMIRKSTNSVKG